LDGDHRTNLIDHYFPHAAPQVVILSTDTEFTRQRYERLKHAIGREYTIEFQDAEKASAFRTGYLLGADDAS
jgi:DNA sulfur modification protein DndD